MGKISNFFKTLWLKFYMNVVLGTTMLFREQIWDRHRTPKPKDLLPGEGRWVVITGGNRGIGFEAVQMFLEHGYKVIIGCRKPDSCLEALNKLYPDESSSKRHYECLGLDLTSLESVRSFANEVKAKNIPIQVLVNNAGIMFGPRSVTSYGCEMQLGVNHVAHFLLTSLLLPQLKAAGTPSRKARIVNVSSMGHFLGSWFDFDDLTCSKYYSPEASYGNSKAAQILFTRYLSDKMATDESCKNIVTAAIHPGVVNTGLYEHVPLVPVLLSSMMKTPKQGGDTIIFSAISKTIEGQSGQYYDNGRVFKPSAFTRRVSNQVKLWNASLRLVGLEDFGV